jgi:hypothetical protein
VAPESNSIQIRILGHDLPGASCGPGPDYPDGHPDIHVAVQRRNRPAELLGVFPGSATTVEWTLECSATDGPAGCDVRGPYVQGPRGGRFVYLSWGVLHPGGEFVMFRRAKLMLDGVPPDVLRGAMAGGVLVGRLGLTDGKGNPLCAAVRPR